MKLSSFFVVPFFVVAGLMATGPLAAEFVFVESFSLPFEAHGIAFDGYEFAKDGTLIGQLIDIDPITDNGVGLYYDGAQARLYVTDQFNAVAVFQRITIFTDGFETGDTSAWSSAQP